MYPKRAITLLMPMVLLVAATGHAAAGATDAGSTPRAPAQAQAQEPREGHDGHHAHHATADVADIEADHVRWETDAPLRQGMRRMRDAIDGIGDAASAGPDQARVLAAAAEVDQAAAFMFANCKLDPKPDAALHGLLARLMAGAQALRQAPDDADALVPMRAALIDYGGLFDDPAFAVDAPAHRAD